MNTANTNIISANSITTTTANTANSVSIELNEIDNNGIEMYNPSINNWQRPFLRTVLSAENGTGSTARVGTLSVIWVILSILIYLVIINHKIPDNILSLGYFSTLIIVTLYSPLKIADILTSYLSKKR